MVEPSGFSFSCGGTAAFTKPEKNDWVGGVKFLTAAEARGGVGTIEPTLCAFPPTSAAVALARFPVYTPYQFVLHSAVPVH